MRKIATLGVLALFAALPFTMATAPAQASGISFGFGDFDDYGFDDFDDFDDAEIVVELDDFDVDVDEVDDEDTDHVAWCSAHYQTYDEDTDMYFYAAGKQTLCISP